MLRVRQQIRIDMAIFFVVDGVSGIIGKHNGRGYLIAPSPLRYNLFAILSYNGHLIKFLHLALCTCKAP